MKTVTLVGGEGEGADRRYTTVGGGSGLNRRELFTDARDISSNVGSDDALTDAEYMAQLQQRGKEKISLTGTLYRLRTNTDTRQKLVFLKLFIQKIRTVIPSIRLLRL